MKKFLSLLAALCLACALAAPALADAPTVGGTIEEAVAISADTTWDEATTLAANLTVNPGVTLTLNAGVTVSGKVTVSGGGTIQRGEGFTGVMVRVLGKEDLTADLTLENITLDGGAVWGTAYNETYDGTDRTVFDILGHSTQNTGLFNSDQIIKIEGKSTLNLKSGAIIQNNDTSSDGSGALNGDKGGSRGAVTILSASTCNIYDGAIVRNNLGTNGGGIQPIQPLTCTAENSMEILLPKQGMTPLAAVQSIWERRHPTCTAASSETMFLWALAGAFPISGEHCICMVKAKGNPESNFQKTMRPIRGLPSMGKITSQRFTCMAASYRTIQAAVRFTFLLFRSIYTEERSAIIPAAAFKQIIKLRLCRETCTSGTTTTKTVSLTI